MSQAHEKSSHGSGAFTLGPEFGFAYGNTIHSVPYVISGIKYAHAYSKTTSSTINGLSQTTSNSADGYRIPLYTGIMVPIFEGLGVQLETGFTYSHLRYSSDEYSMGTTYDQDMSTFSISIGVCGIGKSTAISFLNTLIDFL